MIANPFEGDPEFFDVRPQTFGTELPQAEVENGEIRLAYVRTDHDPEALKRDYERALSIINQNLSSLRESARTSNSRLEELALEYETAEEVVASMKSGIFDSVEAKLKERATSR